MAPEILDQLSKVDQKALADHLAALQAEEKKLVGDAKAMRMWSRTAS